MWHPQFSPKVLKVEGQSKLKEDLGKHLATPTMSRSQSLLSTNGWKPGEAGGTSRAAGGSKAVGGTSAGA